jgi:hypothetical protein
VCNPFPLILKTTQKPWLSRECWYLWDHGNHGTEALPLGHGGFLLHGLDQRALMWRFFFDDQSPFSVSKTKPGWWFGTRVLFSISYMGCHHSHWRTPLFFKMLKPRPRKIWRSSSQRLSRTSAYDSRGDCCCRSIAIEFLKGVFHIHKSQLFWCSPGYWQIIIWKFPES